MTVSPLSSVPSIRSIQSGPANFLFCLFVSLSMWVFVYLDSVHFGVGQHDILPT